MSGHLVTTDATVRTCPRCGALVLAGIAEGLGATVDLNPITDETMAIRADRWTYGLIAGQLTYRDDFQRAAGRAGPILAEHRCPLTTLF